jgi:hypothetical protein
MTANQRQSASRYTSNRLPSKVRDQTWVFAESPNGNLRDLRRSGKWIVYVAPEHHDEVWKKVRTATRKGTLGVSAKAATAKPNGSSRALSVIVYTADYEDHDDVRRVLAGVRDIGINGRLSYKRDEDTLAQRYGKDTAIYVSQPDSLDFEDRRSA